jgi:hypothetical protein
VATYPSQLKTFQNKSNTTDIIDASHPNTIQDELAAVQSTLGTVPYRSTTPSSSGTFNATSFDFDTVKARLANIETGIVTDTHSQYIRKTADNANVITPTNTTTKGFVIKAISGQTANLQEWQAVATITNVVAAGGGVTYTAANTFKIGQLVTITGMSPGAYNLTNQTITDATATFFTITNGATGTFVSGGTATSTVTAINANGQLEGYVPLSLVAAKGDLLVGTSSNNMLKVGVGANGSYLVADSTVAGGIKWLAISPITASSSENLENKTITAAKINLGIVNETTGTRLLGLDDNGKMIVVNFNGTNGIRIPLNSAVPFPIGAQIHITNIHATGTVTVIVEDAGVTLGATPGPRLRTRYSTASVIKIATNSWILVGDLKE